MNETTPTIVGTKDIIRKLETLSPHRPSRSDAPVDWVGMRMVWSGLAVMVLGVLVELACIGAVKMFPDERSALLGMAQRTVVAIDGIGVVALLVLLALPLIRWRHRLDDRVTRVNGAYNHQLKQVQSLASHDLEELKSVERFYAARPTGVQGYFGSLFGSGTMSLTSVVAGMGVAKLVFDVQPLTAHTSGFPLSTVLWFLAVIGVVLAIATRGALMKSTYHRTVLAEAIALSSIQTETNESPDASSRALGVKAVALNQTLQ